MVLFFALLVLLAGILLWTILGINMYRSIGSPGVRLFLLYFLLYSASVGLLWIVIVFPVYKCSGLSCDLDEKITFLGVSLALFTLWPFYIYFFLRKGYRKQQLEESQDIF